MLVTGLLLIFNLYDLKFLRPLTKGPIVTLYNVCSVHRGVFSTSGGYHEYIGGITWVHRGVFSTSEGYHEYIRGFQYIGGIPWVHGGISWVHRGDIMIHVRGYHEYIGRCWVHQGIPWVHRGDIMSTSGDIMSTSGDVQYIGVFSRNWKDFIKLLPHMYHYILPMYWTSPDVLMISLRCTEHRLMYSWYPPHSSWYPPKYWTSPDVPMIFPDVLMVSPDVLNTSRCTEHPPMYWTHIIQGDSTDLKVESPFPFLPLNSSVAHHISAKVKLTHIVGLTMCADKNWTIWHLISTMCKRVWLIWSHKICILVSVKHFSPTNVCVMTFTETDQYLAITNEQIESQLN